MQASICDLSQRNTRPWSQIDAEKHAVFRAILRIDLEATSVHNEAVDFSKVQVHLSCISIGVKDSEVYFGSGLS